MASPTSLSLTISHSAVHVKQHRVMYLGKIIEFGEISNVLDNSDHPYTQALMVAMLVPVAERKRGGLNKERDASTN